MPWTPAIKQDVFQDGADFYLIDEDGESNNTVTAPIEAVGSPVYDSDLDAAKKAREWFINVYCVKANIIPVWN